MNPRVASRYAKSLLDLSIEKGLLEETYKDMLYLQDLSRQSRDFANLLKSPVVKADTKEKAIAAVTEGQLKPLTTSFIHLVISKAREGVMPEVISSFVSQYKEYKQIHIIKLTTATPVSDSLKDQIVSKVKAESGYEQIELESKVDPSIIGGFVLQSGDKLVNASISYDLRNILRQFENNDYLYKVR